MLDSACKILSVETMNYLHIVEQLWLWAVVKFVSLLEDKHSVAFWLKTKMEDVTALQKWNQSVLIAP